jgi:hypothetical protein
MMNRLARFLANLTPADAIGSAEAASKCCAQSARPAKLLDFAGFDAVPRRGRAAGVDARPFDGALDDSEERLGHAGTSHFDERRAPHGISRGAAT